MNGKTVTRGRSSVICAQCDRTLKPRETVWQHSKVNFHFSPYTFHSGVKSCCRACAAKLHEDDAALPHRYNLHPRASRLDKQTKRGWLKPQPCQGCGRSIVQNYAAQIRRHGQLWCCERCRKRRYYFSKCLLPVTCAACEKKFTPLRSDARTCSRTCRSRAWRAKRMFDIGVC